MIPELIKEMLIPPPHRKGKERHNEVRDREAGKPGRWGQCPNSGGASRVSRYY